jgi:hypothetical protein
VVVTQVSHDIYTDAQAQHNTEVEPDTFVSGSTIVSAFQVGRVSGGGASNIGWATSVNGGATWTHGYLPGITTNGGGTFLQASDASVAFDARHNVWMISSLAINGSTVDVVVSRSTDGGLTWGNPVIVATGSNDKNWTVCDNTSMSPHFGNCYTEYDLTSSGDSIRMRTSTGPARARSPSASRRRKAQAGRRHRRVQVQSGCGGHVRRRHCQPGISSSRVPSAAGPAWPGRSTNSSACAAA